MGADNLIWRSDQGLPTFSCDDNNILNREASRVKWLSDGPTEAQVRSSVEQAGMR